MSLQQVDPTRPETGRFPVWLTSWVRTALAMLVGAAAVVGSALPLRPDRADAFADLGWFLAVLGGLALVAVLVGTTTLYVTLRRGSDPHPGATALVFLPVAVALGAVSAGVAALLAPGIAFWLVSGFSTLRTADGRPGPRGGRSGGRPQQVALGVVALLLVVGVAAGVPGWV